MESARLLIRDEVVAILYCWRNLNCKTQMNYDSSSVIPRSCCSKNHEVQFYFHKFLRVANNFWTTRSCETFGSLSLWPQRRLNFIETTKLSNSVTVTNWARKTIGNQFNIWINNVWTTKLLHQSSRLVTSQVIKPLLLVTVTLNWNKCR